MLDIHISRHLAHDLFCPTKSRLTYFISDLTVTYLVPLKSQAEMTTITLFLLTACNRKMVKSLGQLFGRSFLLHSISRSEVIVVISSWDEISQSSLSGL